MIYSYEKDVQIEWINIIRGFAIFLIALGHSIGYSEVLTGASRYLSSFYVPLFFFVSGYLFKDQKRDNTIVYVKKKAKRDLVPYYVFALLSLIPYYLFASGIQASLGSDKNLSNGIFTSLWIVIYGSGHGNTLSQNSPLWFLPCHFLVVVIAKLAYERIGDFKFKSLVLAVTFLLIGGIVYRYLNFAYPYGFETALVMLYFYFLGNQIKKIRLDSNKIRFILGIVFLIAGFAVHLFNGRISCMNNNYQDSYIIFIVAATFSVIGYCYMFSCLKKCSFFSYLGKYTIPILVMHKMPLVVFQSKLGIISTYLHQGNVFCQASLALLMALASIFLSILAYKIITKLIPWTVVLYGEDYNKKDVSY